MKRIIFFIPFLLIVQIAKSQVETNIFPKKNAFEQVKHIKDHPNVSKTKKFPSFDSQKMIEEDKLTENLDIPFRFGKGFDVHITLDDGDWVDVEDGQLWSMEFKSEGAFSINFVFDQFYLPEGAELYITNFDGTMLYGPVTYKHNTKDGYFLTDLIQGDDVKIYLFEPDSVKRGSRLTIKRIVHAYRDFNLSYGNPGASGSCNNDINCYSNWDEESDAVALVLLSDGTERCSGSLLMTADKSFQPFFLSAFHCIDANMDDILSETEISNCENWLFKYQYKKISCGGGSVGGGITYNGADFRAAWENTDFALLEMNSSPIGDTRFSWLGWDRSGNSPNSGTCIHHPKGDVMKISFDNDVINETNYLNISTGTRHWYVDIDNGTLENGSSGSPLFNENRKVVGQLHGGYKGCNNTNQFWFGCLFRSWTGGGTNSTRLSNWLDPCGTGITTINTARSPYITGPSLVCTSGGSFYINNLPSGQTVSWSFSSNLDDNYGGSNFIALYAIGSGSGWVRATINNGCTQSTTIQKNFWVGVPPVPTYTWDATYTIAPGETERIDLLNATIGDATSWTWTPGSYFISCATTTYNTGVGYIGNEVTVASGAPVYSPPLEVPLYVRANNTCGVSNQATATIFIDDGSKSVKTGALVNDYLPNSNVKDNSFFLNAETKEKLIEILDSGDGVVQIIPIQNTLGDIVFYTTNGRQIIKNNITDKEVFLEMNARGLLLYRFVSRNGKVLTGKIIVK
jgi:lysyl endopeptidase